MRRGREEGRGREVRKYEERILLAHVIPLNQLLSDAVDIKPANMEELTEVITATQFHPHNCYEFIYSSSKGTIRLCDMREKALCDQHAKCKI